MKKAILSIIKKRKKTKILKDVFIELMKEDIKNSNATNSTIDDTTDDTKQNPHSSSFL